VLAFGQKLRIKGLLLKRHPLRRGHHGCCQQRTAQTWLDDQQRQSNRQSQECMSPPVHPSMPCTASIDQCLQEWAIGCTQILTEENPQAEAGDPRVDVEEPSGQELAQKAHRPGE
jgi:hypothetical protein